MSVPQSQMTTSSTKIIAVVGPTASGKSELAVRIAKMFNGEIISCDSRQIYTGMDIGTGKVPGKWGKNTGIHPSAPKSKIEGRIFLYKSVPHHCIDYVDPNKQYSVSLFQHDAQAAMQDIRSRGKLPILCGGTGLWVDAVALNQKIPEVKPNLKLRKELEKHSLDELYDQLKKLDPDRAAVIDWHNPRRLIRALEIVLTTGKPVPIQSKLSNPQSNILWFGVYLGQDELFENIKKRLRERLKNGMIKEVQQLHASGLSWQRLEDFGLEYKYASLFLQKKLTEEEMFDQLLLAIQHYAKRQMTWFRRNENILWLQPDMDLEPIIKKFLK